MLAAASVAALYYAMLSDYRATLRQAAANAGGMARAIEEGVGRSFVVSGIVLQRAEALVGGRAPEVLAATPGAWEPLRALADEFQEVISVSVVDRHGRLVLATIANGATADVSDREYFQAHRAGEQTFVGRAVRGRVKGTPFFTLSRRLEDEDGGFAGVLLVGIKADQFSRIYASLDLGPNSVVALLRTDGALLTRHPMVPDIDTASVANFRAFGAGGERSGVVRERSALDGVERQVAWRRMDHLPLVVAVGQSTEAILAEWRWRQVGLLAVVLPLVAVLAGLAWLALRSMRCEDRASRALVTALADKEALLADKDMLLSEVHHRVKNNLQIIQSLLTMEALAASPEARVGYEDSLQRIQAMGMVHELLYKSGDFGRIRVGDYLERLCRLLVGEDDDRIQMAIDADEVHLDLDRAVPFAMAVNEIVSNVLKHAFPGGRPGQVRVYLRNRDGQMALTVADDGVGLPQGCDPAKAGSLGLRLLAGLARQLNGDLEFRSRGGTQVRLRFAA